MATNQKRTYGTGSVFYREDTGYWVGSARDASGKQHHVYAKTKKKAEIKLEELKERIARGEVVSERMTVGAYLERWLEGIQKRRSWNTWCSYRYLVRDGMVPYIGKIQLGKLSPHHVQQMLEKAKAAGMGPATVNRVRSALRSALSQAEREGYVYRNVAKLTEPAKEEREEVKPLTADEIARLRARVKGHRLEPLVEMALGSGLRISELLGLRWEDVDLERSMLECRVQLQRPHRQWELVPLKTKKSRRKVKLPPFAVAALRAWRNQHRQERLQAGTWQNEWGLIFTTESGRPLYYQHITYAYTRYAKRLRLSAHHFHALRHTYASLLLAEGVPLHEVSRSLGHSNIQTTMDIYGHLYEEGNDRAAEAIDRALRRAQ
jgi:integrase